MTNFWGRGGEGRESPSRMKPTILQFDLIVRHTISESETRSCRVNKTHHATVISYTTLHHLVSTCFYVNNVGYTVQAFCKHNIV